MAKNLSIVIPYRDRLEHLNKFIPHIKQFFELNHPDIIYTINIIEQANHKLFNKAMLLNVGFTITKNNHDYFCFHDIDMLPVNKTCDYSYVDSPTHLAGAAQQFGYRMPYSTYFGGVFMFNKEDFIKVNGLCNEYWGWGVEDDDLYNRCNFSNLIIKQKNGRYDSLPHKKNEFDDQGKVNPNVLKNRQLISKKMRNKKEFNSDGLTTLVYTLLETIEIEPNVKLYKVDI